MDDDNSILAIVEERTRLLPDMDHRLRDLTKNQASITTKVNRNTQDIKEIDGKVDKLKALDRAWTSINSIALAVLIYFQTGKMP